MAYLYSLTAPNGKAYLGITNISAEQRWNRHAASARNNSSLAIHRAIRKYGWENFKKEILVQASFAYVKELEIKAIAIFNTFTPFGYNLTKGGDGVLGTNYFLGKKHTPETIAKMQLAQKGHLGPMNGKHHTATTKKKIAEAQTGEKAYWFGKKLSEETKQKMSAARKGKLHTFASKELLSIKRKAQWADHTYRTNNIAGQKNKKYICPHCNLTGGGGMLRWHFDHCKFNAENA
jgi:group I intron endonuclease